MQKVQTQHTSHVRLTQRKKTGRRTSYDTDSRSSGGEMLVEFTKRNRLRIMNTFFGMHRNMKWPWKSLSRETKNETDFIMSRDLGRVKDIEVG